MADTADKVVIEIALDDGSVKQVFGRIKKDAQDLAKDGDKALSRTTSGLVSNLGDAKEELIALGTRFAVVGGSIAAVGFAIKKALDFTVAGEQLLAAEKTFDRFAANAGLANLRDSLEAASQGLVDVGDILPRATTALLNFESGAERIPELLDLAVESARQFGGTAEDRFEALIAAVESGNTKILKNQGIVLDANKVFNEYANAVGLTASELTLANRQQAVLNAVLAEGAKRASDQVESITPLADAFKRTRVAFNDLIESIQKSLSETVGPFFTKMLNGISDVISSASKGSAAVKNGAVTDLADLRASVMKAEGNVSMLKTQLQNVAKPSLANWASVTTAKDLRDRLAEAEQNLGRLQSKFKEASKGFSVTPQTPEMAAAEGQTTADKPKTKDAFVFTKEQIAARQARNAELLALDVAAFQSEVALGEQRIARITDEETRKQAIIDLFDQQSTLLLNQRQTELAALETKFSSSNVFTEEQKQAARLAVTEKYKNLLIGKEEELGTKINEKAMKASLEYQNILRNGIVRSTVAGLESMGRSLQAGSMNWEDFGKSIIGVVGDMAIQLGTSLIAQGLALEAFITAISSLLPGAGLAAAAAGAGLVIFGSALKASVGATGSGIAPSTPGSGSIGAITSPTETAPISDTIEQQKPNTEVVVNINGSVYDSDETGMRIVDLINSAFDKQGIVIKRGVVA